MRKYYTIEKTLHTSKPALKKMIDATAGSRGKPKRIEKNSEVEKIFSHLWAKKYKILISGQKNIKF